MLTEKISAAAASQAAAAAAERDDRPAAGAAAGDAVTHLYAKRHPTTADRTGTLRWWCSLHYYWVSVWTVNKPLWESSLAHLNHFAFEKTRLLQHTILQFILQT